MIGRSVVHSVLPTRSIRGVVRNMSNDNEGSTLFLVETSKGGFIEVLATECKAFTDDEIRIGNIVTFVGPWTMLEGTVYAVHSCGEVSIRIDDNTTYTMLAAQCTRVPAP